MAKVTLPSQTYLKHCLDYAPETGILTWRHRPNRSVQWNAKNAGKPAGGSKNSTGYIDLKLDGRTYRAHRLVWVISTGGHPVHQIDHINGNRADNRMANLREATHSQNCHNAKKSANNTSGYKNVYWIKARRKWQSFFMFKGQIHYVGSFKSASEAHAAYCEMAAKVIGGFFNPGH